MKLRIVTLLLCAVAVASAQLYPNKLAMIQSASFYMSDPRIQLELKLTPDQVQGVNTILGEHAETQRGISEKLAKAKDTQYGQIQSEMDKLDLATSDKLIAALNLTQKKRLKQIAYQENGAFALRNAAIAKEVGLAPAQRTKIETICQATSKSMDDVNAKMADEIVKVPNSGTKAGEDKKNAIAKKYIPVLDGMEAKAKKDILATLTPAQSKKWQSMLGKPFKV